MSEAKFKVMFVDEDRFAVEPLMDYTQSLGHEAIYVSSIADATSYLEKESNNLLLIVSELRVDGADAIEFRAKMLTRYADIPLLIQSHNLTESIKKRALALKINKLFDKPLDFQIYTNFLNQDCADRQRTLIEKRSLRQTFLGECSDLLEELEPLILEIERDAGSAEPIHGIFRVVHTIKGGSGVLDWPEFTKFLHSYEDLLTKLKAAQTKITPTIVSKLLRGCDFIREVLSSLEDDTSLEIDHESWEQEFHLGPSGEPRQEATAAEKTGKKSVNNEQEDSIKVPTHVLDEFMELSGEITVIRNTVNKLVRSLQKEIPGNRDVSLLSEYLDEMHKINSSMQNKITELRKVSLQSIFKSYPRVVRDLSLSLHKDIELKLVNEGLHIDTKIANVLRHSLIHLIRNSADHGLEKPEERRTKGKTPRGTITLSANEQGEEIIIDIVDDGRGINIDAVKKRAVERGLFTQAEIDKLSEKQIYKIILEAGFSTAQVVTDVSGRGVGMDMVKSSIEGVGGRIEIDSERGKGSRFNLRMPIPKSVLIIHSLRVKAGTQQFNIPQDRIVRLIKIDEKRRRELIKRIDSADVLNLSGVLYQLANLQALVQNERLQAQVPAGDVNIVLVRSESSVFGLVVDAIEDSEEIVVKRLAPQIHTKTFLGATFLGDGMVGLILDIQGIAAQLNLNNEDRNPSDMLTTSSSTVPTIELLIFSLGAGGRCSLPLDHVYRLEELNPQHFNYVGGKLTTIYRDQVLPLLFVDQVVNNRNSEDLLEFSKIPTIICQVDDRSYGLMVSKIDEILACPDEIDSSIDFGPFIEGNLIIGSKVITVLNMHKILGTEAPKLKLVEEQSLVSPTIETEQEIETISPAAGWGLF